MIAACYIEAMFVASLVLSISLGSLSQDSGPDVDSMYREGIDAYNSGDYQAAVEVLERVARRSPNVPDFRYHLGLSYLKAGEPKKAASEFEATLARTGMERSTRLREPEVLAMAGVAYFYMGRTKLARERIELALSRQEGLPQAIYTLGLIDLSEGERERAIDRFHEAVDGDPGHTDAHLALAQVLEDGQVDWEHVLEHLDLASGASPHNLSIRLEYGRVALAAGQLENAEAAYVSVLANAPSDDVPAAVNARFNLGTLLLGRGDLEKAIEHLSAVVDASPSRGEARFNLAEALRRVGKFDEAKRELLRLVEMSADYSGAPFALALVHEGLDELGEAEMRYRESIAAENNHVPAYLNLAALLERQRRGPDAISVLEQCLELELEDAQRRKLEDILEAMKKTSR